MTASVTEQELVVHRHDFTMAPNATLRDERLSFRARGVLLWMLSHSDGYRFTSETLAQAGREGRDAIRGALKELTMAGYYRAERKRVSGRWHTKVHVYEQPHIVTDESPIQETENQALVNRRRPTRLQEIEDKEEDKPRPDAEASNLGDDPPPDVAKRVCDAFDAFVKKDTGHRPPETWMAIRAVVAAAIKEGFPERRIKDGLAAIHRNRPRPITRQTLWEAMRASARTGGTDDPIARKMAAEAELDAKNRAYWAEQDRLAREAGGG